MLIIYHSVANLLIESSVNNGVNIEDWIDNLKPFTDFNSINSFEKLYDWCRNAIKRYIDYLLVVQQKSNHFIVDNAKKFIKEHINEEMTLEDVASLLYVHPCYLSRLFKQRVGMSITDYRIICRVEKAKELFKTPGIKIYEVAERVGCGSVSSFNRIFKSITGTSPKEYQNLMVR